MDTVKVNTNAAVPRRLVRPHFSSSGENHDDDIEGLVLVSPNDCAAQRSVGMGVGDMVDIKLQLSLIRIQDTAISFTKVVANIW